MTIRLISVTTQYKALVNRAPKDEINTGDVLWAKSILRNEVAQFGWPKGVVVGSDAAIFTVVSATKIDARVTAKLPGGTLKGAGRIGPAEPNGVALEVQEPLLLYETRQST